MVVIDGYGGYVPLYRIDREAVSEQNGGRATGETAVPGRDENHVTMASEAASNALSRASVKASALGGVFSASVSDPFAEHGIAAHVAYRLGGTGTVRTADLGGSSRAATDAFAVAHTAVEAGAAPALVVAADIIPAMAGHESLATAGAGAAAVVLDNEASKPAATVAAEGVRTTGFVERHRRHCEAPEIGDEAFEVEQGVVPTAAALADDLAFEDPDHLVASAATDRLAGGIAGAFGTDERHTVYDDVGYAGAASFYLDLVSLLETAATGETAVAVTYGPGGAGAVLLEIGAAGNGDVLTVGEYVDAKEAVSYARHLENREPIDYRGIVVP